jgi:hypothetical protein
MMDMHSVEHDLLEMKATTLYKYGKKLEIAEEMYHKCESLTARLEKIMHRLKSENVIRKGLCRKNKQKILTERIENKLQRASSTLKKLENLKDRYKDEFKSQREACGLTDHTFIDEFYKD